MDASTPVVWVKSGKGRVAPVYYRKISKILQVKFSNFEIGITHFKVKLWPNSVYTLYIHTKFSAKFSRSKFRYDTLGCITITVPATWTVPIDAALGLGVRAQQKSNCNVFHPREIEFCTSTYQPVPAPSRIDARRQIAKTFVWWPHDNN